MMYHNKVSKMSHFTLSAILALSVSLFSLNTVYAQDPTPATKTIKIEKEDNDGKNKTLVLEESTAEVLHLNGQVSEIMISDPTIADIEQTNSNIAYIIGKKPGKTTIIAANSKGVVLMKIKVHVSHNLEQLRKFIKTNPGAANVKITPADGTIMLSGTVTSPKVAADIMTLASRFVKSGDGIVNQIQIKAPVQVSLHIKIAEVKRSALNRLGFNLGFQGNLNNFTFNLNSNSNTINSSSGSSSANSGTTTITTGGTTVTTTPGGGTVTTGTGGGGNSNPGADFANGSGGTSIFSPASGALGTFGAAWSSGGAKANAILDALASDSLATILAEPNLIAMSGETASFLAGGEYPVPAPSSSSGNTGSVDFKSYGVSLSFTPTVIDSNTIILKISQEYSSLDAGNAVTTVPGGSPVKGTLTRRAETTVQLGSGQSLPIAGLLMNRAANNMNNTPVFSDIPIIGALFRASEMDNEETELVMVVTPYLVEPVSADSIRLPTDNIRLNSPLKAITERKLMQEQETATPSSIQSINDGTPSPSTGYVLE